MKLSYVFGLACISLLVGTPTWAQQEPTKDLLVGTPTRAQQEPMKEMTCRHPKNWKPTDDELQRVLSEHRQWAKKQHYEPFKDPPDQTEGRANLCNADLSNAELNKANLAWAVLNGANLDEAKLNDAILFGAQLNGANLWDAQLNRTDLRRAELNEALLHSAQLNEANLAWAKLNKAILRRAKLNRADLSFAELKEAYLFEAEMNETGLGSAKLSNAVIRGAKLNKADLTLANLDQAVLSGSYLNEADLSAASVADAHLDNVDLTGALYAPNSAAPDSYVAQIKGLKTVTFPAGHEVGLVQLRDLMQKAGLRDLERQATFAIENGRTRNSIATWREDPGGAAEGIFRKIAFDFPTRYGLNPARALLAIAAVWALLIPVYAWPIRRQPRTRRASAIYRVWPKDRVELRDGKPTLDNPACVERLHTRGLAAVGWSAYFFLLSAFQIGFREFSVGTWLARAQPRSFVLEATGWVRTLSGLQSLLSVYLLAVWLLTYFGRPFQ